MPVAIKCAIYSIDRLRRFAGLFRSKSRGILAPENVKFKSRHYHLTGNAFPRAACFRITLTCLGLGDTPETE
jgi:hypothetical protein